MVILSPYNLGLQVAIKLKSIPKRLSAVSLKLYKEVGLLITWYIDMSDIFNNTLYSLFLFNLLLKVLSINKK